MTIVVYRIQERSADVDRWRTIPIDWSTEDAARAALNHDMADDADEMLYRIVRVTTEVLPSPAADETGAGPGGGGA